MRRPLCAAALLCLALCASPSRAAFTTLLAPLAAAVDVEAAKLGGLTDAKSRKKRHQLETISDNLKLDHSETVADDVGILRANGATLLKVFGSTYQPVADALTALTARVRADIDVLDMREGGVVDAKTKAKVGKLVVKATSTLDAIDSTKPFANRVAKVLAASETVEAAGKRIDADAKCPKADPPGGRHGVLRATIGTREFSSIYLSTSLVRDKLTNALKRFVVGATREIGGQGDTVTIFIENYQFHGAGVYAVDNKDVLVIYEFPKGTFFNIRQGTVEITSYDDVAHDLRGTFTGTFDDGAGATLNVEDGAFESCNWADHKEL